MKALITLILTCITLGVTAQIDRQYNDARQAEIVSHKLESAMQQLDSIKKLYRDYIEEGQYDIIRSAIEDADKDTNHVFIFFAGHIDNRWGTGWRLGANPEHTSWNIDSVRNNGGAISIHHQAIDSVLCLQVTGDEIYQNYDAGSSVGLSTSYITISKNFIPTLKYMVALKDTGWTVIRGDGSAGWTEDTYIAYDSTTKNIKLYHDSGYFDHQAVPLNNKDSSELFDVKHVDFQEFYDITTFRLYEYDGTVRTPKVGDSFMFNVTKSNDLDKVTINPNHLTSYTGNFFIFGVGVKRR